MKAKHLLTGTAALMLAIMSCSKSPKEKMVNTWTLKEVNADGSTIARINSAVKDVPTDSIAALISHVENSNQGTVYVLGADGSCTIKTSAGEEKCQWEMVKKSSGNALTITTGGKVVETWNIYDDEIILGHDCSCLTILLERADATMERVDGGKTVTLTCSIYPESMDGLSTY